MVDSRVHFLDYSSLDSLGKPFILISYTYSVFKIFNLNQSLDSRLVCPTANYITTLVCVITGQNQNLSQYSHHPHSLQSCLSPFQIISCVQIKTLEVIHMTSFSLLYLTFWPLASQNTLKVHREFHLFLSYLFQSLQSKSTLSFTWFICNTFLTGLSASHPIPHHHSLYSP